MPWARAHAVDVVLTFEGDPRSGLRIVSGGKNRFGTEGETAWFQMGATGLASIDPADEEPAQVELRVSELDGRRAATFVVHRLDGKDFTLAAS